MRSARRRRPASRSRGTSSRCSFVEVSAMLLESVANAEDQGARPQLEWRLRVRVRQRAKAAIERGKPCVCSGAISFRQGRERRVELRAEAESRCNPPKIDDLATNRERGQHLRPLRSEEHT